MTCEECGKIKKALRTEQYSALLSVENVCFNDKEFYQSLAKYELCCELLGEKSNDKTLDEVRELR